MNEKELDSKNIIELDINIIWDILKQTWRKYLNIYRNEIDSKIDITKIYCLSYIKQNISEEMKIYDYIVTVLNDYIEFLNKDNTVNKYKELLQENTPSYIIWKSILLDITSENWEKYKAGSLFVKKYIKREKSGLFYLDEKWLKKILNDKNYITYIFFLDEINITFSYNKLFLFLKNLWSIDRINQFFLDFELDEINKVLEKKFKIWKFNLYNDSYDTFKDFIREVDLSKDYSIENYALFIARKLFSLHFNPYHLSTNKMGQKKYNRKEILKSSKTEDKLDNTFSSEIFNLALS